MASESVAFAAKLGFNAQLVQQAEGIRCEDYGTARPVVFGACFQNLEGTGWNVVEFEEERARVRPDREAPMIVILGWVSVDMIALL